MAKGAVSVVIKGEYDSKDIDAAIRDLERMKKQSGSTKSDVGGLSNTLKGLAIAAAGAFTLNELVGFMKDAATAAAADQKSMVALATAMDNVGLSSQNAIAESFIKDLMLATGTADDDLRPALQSLITATGSLETAQSALSLAMDVSTGTGRSLSQTTQALVRAYSGQTTGLSRLGAGLDAALLKSKDMDAITAALSAKFGGQAAAAAETYAGKMQRVQTAAGEAQETIGYALLNALDGLASAMGGTNGVIGFIDELGQGFAYLITGVGDVSSRVAGLITGLGNLTSATQDSNEAGQQQVDWFGAALQVIPIAGAYLGAYYHQGKQVTEEQERMAESMRQATAQAMLEGRAVSDAARAHSGLATTADVAADAVERLDEKFKEIKGSLSDQAALDNYEVGLRKIRDELDKSSRSLDVNTDAGAKNRDAIIGLFNDAATAAQAWGNKAGATTAEVEAKFATMTGDIRRKLIKEGFSKTEIDAFLGGMGLWDSSTRGMIRAAAEAAKQEAKAAAISKFAGIGIDLAKGLMSGIQSGQVYPDAAVREMIRKAESAARAEAQSKSPSKLFALVGLDLALGVVDGLETGKGKVKEKSKELIQDALNQIQSKVEEARQFGQGIADNLFANLDISAAMEQAKQTGGNVVDIFVKQAERAQKFAVDMDRLLRAGLNKSTWLQINALGAERGQEVADAYLKGNTGEMVRRTNEAVTAAQGVADAVGRNAAIVFEKAGITAAVSMARGLIMDLMPAGKSRKAILAAMDDLAKSMNRTATITVQTVNAGGGGSSGGGGGPAPSSGTDWSAALAAEVGPTPNQYISDADFNQIFDNLAAMQASTWQPFADGGIVTSPTRGLVGEAGPEAIIPLDRLGGMNGGSNTYNITVQAGVGDPRAIGQQVVEAITRYERANGPVYAKAS